MFNYTNYELMFCTCMKKVDLLITYCDFYEACRGVA